MISRFQNTHEVLRGEGQGWNNDAGCLASMSNNRSTIRSGRAFLIAIVNRQIGEAEKFKQWIAAPLAGRTTVLTQRPMVTKDAVASRSLLSNRPVRTKRLIARRISLSEYRQPSPHLFFC